MTGTKEKRKKELEKTLLFLEKEYHVPASEILQIIHTKERQEKEQQSIHIPVSL